MRAGVGESLREAREQRGLGLDDIQRITKIRIRYLRAIEDERWEELPGPAYVRGFVSTYADVVDLDPAPLLQELDDEVPLVPADILAVADRDVEAAEPPASPLELGERRGRRGRRPLALAAVAVLLVAGGAALALGVLGGGDGDPGADAERTARGEPAREESAPPEESAEEPAEEEPVEEEPAAEPEPAEIEVTLAPSADVWACLLDADGEALVAGEILPAGERAGPFRSQRFVLALGHGSVDVEVDGAPVEVPDSPDPLGFKLRANGAKPLAADEMPDCL